MTALIYAAYSAVGLLGFAISLSIDAMLVAGMLGVRQGWTNMDVGIRVLLVFFLALFALKAMV